jgi:hypothetical protein
MSTISCILLQVPSLDVADAKFPLGRIAISEQAAMLLANEKDLIVACISKHQRGDWSDQHPYNRNANEEALRGNSRIVSIYQFLETEFWIMSEADRSETIVLLASEF